MHTVSFLQVLEPLGLQFEIWPRFNPQNSLSTKIDDYLPVPQFCFSLVHWSYLLVHDSVQLSCEILALTLEAEMLLCDV